MLFKRKNHGCTVNSGSFQVLDQLYTVHIQIGRNCFLLFCKPNQSFQKQNRKKQKKQSYSKTIDFLN